MLSPILNFLAFQVGWFLLAFGAATGSTLWGSLWILSWLCLHVRLQPAPSQELCFLVLAGLIGFVFDSTLVLAEVLVFPKEAGFFGPSPSWMVLLWAGFAATFHGSLRWLIGRPGLAAMLGVVGGPLAYVAGIPFGAIGWGRSESLCLVIVAIEWAVAMPLLLFIENRISSTFPTPLIGPVGREETSET